MQSILKKPEIGGRINSMETLKVEGTIRADLGSKSAKNARKEGQVPCVLYGQGDAVHFAVQPKAVKGLVYTPDFKVAELELGGTSYRAILKDIQFHPVSDDILHIDFLKLTDGVPVKVNIPLRTKGESEGVKLGGKLIQQVRTILVKTKPEDLVAELFVDISDLDLGQAARVKDVEVSDKMEVMNPPATPVVAIEIPRALRSAAAAAAKEAK